MFTVCIGRGSIDEYEAVGLIITRQSRLETFKTLGTLESRNSNLKDGFIQNTFTATLCTTPSNMFEAVSIRRYHSNADRIIVCQTCFRYETDIQFFLSYKLRKTYQIFCRRNGRLIARISIFWWRYCSCWRAIRTGVQLEFRSFHFLECHCG